jgi:hypothetical protein
MFEIAKITYIYWPIERTLKLSFSRCWSLQELPTSIGQLNALQNLCLWGYSKVQELPTCIGQWNAF